MTEKTRLMILSGAIPWIYPILFGAEFWRVGYLQPLILTTIGASFLCAAVGREIGSRAPVLAPVNDANATAIVEKTVQMHPQVEVDVQKPPIDLARLRAHQANPNVHPFTCGSGRRTDEYHLDGEGVLKPTETGWTCPYCDYRQAYGDLERSI